MKKYLKLIVFMVLIYMAPTKNLIADDIVVDAKDPVPNYSNGRAGPATAVDRNLGDAARVWFSDPEGEALTYKATLYDGSPLPDEITFSVVDRRPTISGTLPTSFETGRLIILVTATNASGRYTVDETWMYMAAKTNSEAMYWVFADTFRSAPKVDRPIPDQNVDEDDPFNFTFDDKTFRSYLPALGITYAATLANMDPLPDWLTFDPATRTFSGTPRNDDVEVLKVRVSCRDYTQATDGGPVITFNWNHSIFALTVTDIPGDSGASDPVENGSSGSAPGRRRSKSGWCLISDVDNNLAWFVMGFLFMTLIVFKPSKVKI